MTREELGGQLSITGAARVYHPAMLLVDSRPRHRFGRHQKSQVKPVIIAQSIDTTEERIASTRDHPAMKGGMGFLPRLHVFAFARLMHMRERAFKPGEVRCR